MTLLVHLGMLAATAAVAGLLARFPRRLFAQAVEIPRSGRVEWGLATGLAVIGVAAFEMMMHLSPGGRLGVAICAMALAAVVFADLSYLVIPDLYSVVLAGAALLAAWRLPLVEAAAGAVTCGGLLLALALAWRKLMAVDGLGFGDVKLAAAAGALLGAQAGLLAISLSAGLAALLIYALRLRKGADIGPLIPYGASLSLATAGFLAARLL